MLRQHPMKAILLFLCGVGFATSSLFAYSVYKLVDLNWTFERFITFTISGTVSGFAVSLIAYYIITLVIKRIEKSYNSTLAKLEIENHAKASRNNDVLLNMKEEFGILIDSFLQMKQNLEQKSEDLEVKNGLLKQKNEEVLDRQRQLLLEISTLKESEKKFKSFFRTAIDAIYIMDKQGTILEVNHSTVHILGYSHDELNNKPFPELLHPESRKTFPENLKKLLAIGSKRTELQLITKTGQTIIVDCSSSIISDDKGNIKYLVAFQRDITQLKEKEKQIEYIAYHDVITDLPNRRYGTEFLDMAIERAKRTEKMVGVLFIDLDHFKNINDTFGHSAGDLLLFQVAKRLKVCVSKGDTVIRLGGDEFMVVVDQISNSRTLETLAEKILNEFILPFIVQEQELSITCSIGVAAYPEHGDHAEAIIKNSDIAMYKAKEGGRDSYQVFNNMLHNEISDEMKIRQELLKAIDREEFFVCYQPIINQTTRKIIATEVLVRWNHPEKGVVLPGVFIPVAEKYGLIQQLDMLVMKIALEEIEKIGAENIELGYISFNISASEVNYQLINFLVTLLDGITIKPEQMNIEITETNAMKNPVQAQHVFRNLKKRGLKITIDDFGAGHSSLNYVKEFPVDMIKIDKKFTSSVGFDEANRAIIVATIALSKALGISLVAEGVETKEQLEILQELGCENFQGYYFSRPVSLKELQELDL